MTTGPGTVVPLMQWLRDARRLNELQMDLLGERFDLDGALAAGQPELAWRARTRLLLLGAQLHLARHGLPLPEGLDLVDLVGHALALLDAVNPATAEELRNLLDAPAPASEAGIAAAADEAVRFVADRLGVPVLDRDDAIREWADGVRLLREVAATVGVARTDGWYLSAEEPGARGSWYDEVMSLLGEPDGPPSATGRARRP